MAGDCNTKLSPLDKQGRLTWKETKYRNSLIHFLKEIKLGDIYGEMHPKKFLHVRIKATEVKIQHSFFSLLKVNTSQILMTLRSNDATATRTSLKK